MKPRWRWLPLLALAFLAEANANTTVTLCSSDTEKGPAGTTNLAKALGLGGDIYLVCPAGSILTVSQYYRLQTDTQTIGQTGPSGLPSVALDGGALKDPFLVAQHGKLTLAAVTLQNFHIVERKWSLVTGGVGLVPVSSFGDLELDNVLVSNSGDAVAALGNLRVINSTLSANTGTAVLAYGTATIQHSTFSNNYQALQMKAGEISGSGFFNNTELAVELPLSGAAVSIRGTRFLSNKGRGAISGFLSGGATLVMRESVFASNQSREDGGALNLAAVALTDPSAGGHLQIVTSEFTNNTAGNGGAIRLGLRNSDTVEIVDSNFLSNSASNHGGGLSIAGSATVLVHHALFKKNSASAGSAASSDASTATLSVANALVVENIPTSGSALWGGHLVLANVTIANNQAHPIVIAAGSGPESFANLVISGNSGACMGVTAAMFQGPNLQFPAGTCPGARFAVDPALDSLYIPVLGSSALILGDVGVCRNDQVEGVDIAFQSRKNAHCALGAYERVPPRFVPRSVPWDTVNSQTFEHP